MLNNPYASYKNQSILTMSPEELIVKLYNHAIVQMNLAVKELEKDKLDYSAINNALIKSQRIFEYLASILNPGIDMSKELAAIYEFFMNHLASANVEKKPDKILEVVKLASELRDSFVQAGKTNRSARAQ